MKKILNLINKYYILIIVGDFKHVLKHYGGVAKVFYYDDLNVTISVITRKPDEFIKSYDLPTDDSYYFKLSELDNAQEIIPNIAIEIIDEVKERLNWGNSNLNQAIAFNHNMYFQPTEINKFTIKVKDIDDSLNYLDCYCESVYVKEFLPEFHGILEIETQLNMDEIKEVLRGALIE